jgi:hypothetical protein
MATELLWGKLSQFSVFPRTGRPEFDPQQRQRIFPVASVSSPALRPTQPPIQRCRRFFPGGKARPGRETGRLPHLVPRSRMSRSYISSSPWQLHGSYSIAYSYIVYTHASRAHTHTHTHWRPQQVLFTVLSFRYESARHGSPCKTDKDVVTLAFSE